MRSFLYYIAPLCLLLFPAHVRAQEPLSFGTFSIQSGLSNNSVNCVLNDSRVGLWIGTEHGLNFYEGYQFRKLTDYVTFPPISGIMQIICLAQDSRGYLWAGTANGLLHIRPGQQKVEVIRPDSVKDKIGSPFHILAILVEGDNVWLGTQYNGLCKYNMSQRTFTWYNTESPPPGQLLNNTVVSVFKDKYGTIWAGTRKYLHQLDPATGRVRCLNAKSPATSSREFISVRSFATDTDGNLLLGAWEGLLKYDYASDRILEINEFWPSSMIAPTRINQLKILRSRAVAVATNDQGLCLINPERTGAIYLNAALLQDGIPFGNTIRCMSESREGILWVGTHMEGLKKIDLNAPQVINLSLGKSEAFGSKTAVRAIATFNGEVWIGTQGSGLFRWKHGMQTLAPYVLGGLQAPDAARHIMALCACDGYLWAGTDGAGLLKIDPVKGRVEQFYSSDSLPTAMNNYIFSISCDAQRNLWIGTYGGSDWGGLYRFNPKTGQSDRFYHMDNPNSLSSNIVLSVLADNQNDVWAGTKDQGVSLFRVNEQKWQHFSMGENGIGTQVMCLFLSSNQRIWAGTDVGLCMIDKNRGRVTCYNGSHGMAGNIVYSILEDRHARLWVATDKGISIFDPADKTFVNYNKSAGFINSAYLPQAAAHTPQGLFSFGGAQGISIFNPDSLKQSWVEAIPLLSGLEVYSPARKGHKSRYLPVFGQNTIVLERGENSFTLDMAAVHLSDPAYNRLAYRLEGVDTSWIEVRKGYTRSTYIELAPGTYTLLMKAANSDGLWNNAPVSYQIQVRAAYFALTWLRVFLAVLALALAFLLGGLKIRKKHARQSSDLFHTDNLLHTIIDNLPDYIYAKDLQSRFIIGNLRVSQVMGAQHPEDLNGKTDYDFYKPELADIFYQAEQKLMRTGISLINIEEPGLDEFGNSLVISTSKIPLRDKDGKIIGLVGIGRNITKSKVFEAELMKNNEHLAEINARLEEQREEIHQQDEELRAQANALEKYNSELEKLSLVAQETDNGVVIMDEKGRIEWVNEGFTKITGFALNEIEYEENDDRNSLIYKLKKAVGQCIEARKAITFLAWVRTKNGQRVCLQTTLNPVKRSTGQIYRIIAIESDITKLKLAEEEIKKQHEEIVHQHHELQRLNQTKDKLFSIIAHDLKNPVNAIMGFTEILHKDFANHSPQEVQEIVSLLYSSSTNLQTLLENLLNWSKSQIDGVLAKPEIIDLSMLIAENVELQAAVAGKKLISIQNNADQHVMVKADRNMLAATLRNLLSNALKFTNVNGSVTISTKDLGDTVQVDITDTGIGMEQAEVDRILNSNEFTSKPGTLSEAGTGLGLKICKEFIRKNSGLFEIESTPGKGSRFRFTIPLARRTGEKLPAD